jgi:hypothetical protein
MRQRLRRGARQGRSEAAAHVSGPVLLSQLGLQGVDSNCSGGTYSNRVDLPDILSFINSF